MLNQQVDRLKKFFQPSFRLETSPDRANHVEEIRTKGFTIINGAFSAEAASEVCRDYKFFTDKHEDLVVKNKKSSGFNSRLVNFHSVSTAAMALFENRKLLAVTDQFFGAETVVYTSLFFQEGTQQDIHRDAPYFCTVPEQRYLGVWFALEDADEQNGALRVIPGGHKVSPEEFTKRKKFLNRFYPGLKDSQEIGFTNGPLWDAYQNWVHQDCLQRGLQEKQLRVKKGDVVIWHPMLPHGGGKILSQGRTRMSMVMHVTPKEVEVHGSYLFFAPQLNYPKRKMEYLESKGSPKRRYFKSDWGFMKDE